MTGATLAGMVRRRQFLAQMAALATAPLWPRLARAIGPSEQFRFGHLQLGPGWNPRPRCLDRVSWQIDKRTSIDVASEARVVTLSDPQLHETPFLYLAGDREFALPPERDVDALRRFLTFGGFLLIDSAEGALGGAFDGSVRRLIEALYPPPQPGLEIVRKDHVLFRSFYRLEQPVGRLAISSTLEGVLRDGRLQIAYTQNDLGGAWARDDFGNWAMACQPGGERQREHAFRLGINLVMYALCLDYKSDQVHVEYLMRKRRWRPNDGAEVAE